MGDATMERLSKLISDNTKGRRDESSPRSLWDFQMSFPEGWFLLLLLAAVIYSTVWCVQAAGWVENLGVLTISSAIGLGLGVFASKQQRFPTLPVHIGVICLGLVLPLWQTAGAFYDGNIAATLQGMQQWFILTSNGGASNDDSVFLFLIVVIGFFLSYVSAWLLYRTRAPWLMIAANATVLLINLNTTNDGFIIFLIIFLIASLLLLLRFNLFESIQLWKRKGLRFSDDLGWDVMQAGSLISIGILVFSWVLPGSYKDPVVGQIWEIRDSPLVSLQNTWNRAFSVNSNSSAPNRGNFSDTLALGGNPNLTQEIVFKVKNDDKKGQYLVTVSYDTYASRGGWSIEHEDSESIRLNPNLSIGSGPVMSYKLKQDIEVFAPPGGSRPYLAGAPLITSISLPAKLLNGSGGTVAWLGDEVRLTPGLKYSVTSAVSGADEKTLRTVPLPKDAPDFNPVNPDIQRPVTTYDKQVVKDFTQLPKTLDPRVRQLALQVVADAKATTMYDQVVALETYLRQNYKYNLDVHPKNGLDPVVWFLFENANKDGYCNYFASALSVMTRSLGIPSRVVAGYTSGKLDGDRYVIRGADAHSWTQVYFAGYGWINFEPSASFKTFERPLPNQYPSTGAQDSGTNGGVSSSPGKQPTKIKNDEEQDDGSGSGLSGTDTAALLQQRIGITLGSLILVLIFALIYFSIWWRNLFRRQSLVSQLYGRICVLAGWGGLDRRFSQTPYEYLQDLSVSALPSQEDARALERLGDIYVRERWADPTSKEHPRSNGEFTELPVLWRRLQPRLFLYVLRHPLFLRRLPEALTGQFARLRRRWKERRRLRHDL